jgi:osmotically inducible lipoprotein OsmB
MKNALVAALCAGVLGACSGMTERQQDTAIGAGIGGAAGYGLSGGSGLGTAAGAAAGGFVGNQYGGEIRDRAHR